MGREDQIINERLRKLKELRKLGIDPYPSKYDVKDFSEELQENHKKLKKGSMSKIKAKIAGRLMSFRDFGKIGFGVLQDSTGKIQITIQKDTTPDSVSDFLKKYIDTGDFLGVEGLVGRTEKGELSVYVKKAELLSKSTLPLPEKWHGLQEKDEVFRKRYLDILMNKEVKEMFIRKSKFWNSIRSFLIERNFLEVETPVLENATGGAAAEPFATHHNALDTDVYLRISMGELWQKKLMVAGYGKTFEIGRQFRNEGMDAEHLQDYTQMEFYWAYANFEDGMELVKYLYKTIAKKVYGTLKFEREGHKIDLGKEWKKIDYVSEIKKQTGVDVLKSDAKKIEKKLEELKQDFSNNLSKARLTDLLWKYCRKNVSGPGFLVGHPVEVSPLAKRNQKNPGTVEQFQPILGGTEMGTGYSELNDPFDQEERFKEQRKMKESGDMEAHMHDESFVEALKHGMPPTCGFGLSERLFSFFEGKPIRECVIFPLMKPLDSNKTKGGK
jgi:lysyl-tRNA synthetase, class II